MVQPIGHDAKMTEISRDSAAVADRTGKSVRSDSVRQLTAEDQPSAAITLASAFCRDPLLRWALGNPDNLSDRLLGYFDVLLGIELRKAKHRVHIVNGGSAVAVWRTSDDEETRLSLKLRACPEFVRTFGAYLPRWTRMMSLLRQARPPEPHYQMLCIGTHEEFQRERLGSKLVAKLIERCDTVGVAGYVQVTNPAAIPFFESHGFKSRGKVALQRGAPLVEAMWREPRELQVAKLPL